MFYDLKKRRSLMYSKNYLSVKISHLNYQIKKLPYGRYGTYRGKEVIYIISSPSDPNISWRNHRRYQVNTKRGRKYSEEVTKSNLFRKELESVISEWDKNYKGTPPVLPVPIKRAKGKMNYDFFAASEGEQNKEDSPEMIEYKGIKFRSKNEVIAAQVLDKLNIEYKVEPKLILDGKLMFPDFIIGVQEVDKAAYVEIFGKMDDYEYVDTNAKRNARYIRAGLRQGRDYIPFYTCNSKTFDVEAFEKQILAWLELAAEDIVAQAAEEGEKT